MSFDDDLKAETSAPIPFKDVDIALNGNSHTLRFRKMDGFEWAEEIDKHPARPGVQLDLHFGYNLRSLVTATAPRCGVLVSAGKDVELAPEQWSSVLKSSGSTFQKITDAIWGLNEHDPAQAVEAAKKARTSSEPASA